MIALGTFRKYCMIILLSAHAISKSAFEYSFYTQELVRQIKIQATHLKRYVQAHKIQLGATLAISIFCYQIYRAGSLQSKLRDRTSWVSFEQKRDSNFPDHLMQEIQARYMRFDNVHDFMKPVQQFMVSVDQEIADLKSYEQIAALLKQVGLSIFVDEELYNDAAHKCLELAHLKQICMQWLAQAKCNTNYR